jgi:hypothetical protein
MQTCIIKRKAAHTSELSSPDMLEDVLGYKAANAPYFWAMLDSHIDNMSILVETSQNILYSTRARRVLLLHLLSRFLCRRDERINTIAG